MPILRGFPAFFYCILPRVLDNTHFPDDAHLYLARILELFLYFVSDIAGQFPRVEVRNILRFDNDAYFTACGDGVALLHAGLRVCQGLKLFEAFDVVFDGIAAGTRAAAGNGVGDLHYHGFRRLIRVFLVVRLHRLDYALVHAELLKDAAAYLHVRTRHFMVDSLSDVVEQRPRARDGRVSAQFFRKHAGEMRHLDRVVEDVLAITRAEVEAAEDHKELRVQIRDAGLICGLGPFLFDDGINLSLGFLHGLFYFFRLYAAVENEILERDARYLAAYRVIR